MTTKEQRSAEELLEESAEELLGEAEPWEKWETQLVSGSIGIALIALIVLGWLINTFVLK
jgi:cytochrome b561